MSVVGVLVQIGSLLVERFVTLRNMMLLFKIAMNSFSVVIELVIAMSIAPISCPVVTTSEPVRLLVGGKEFGHRDIVVVFVLEELGHRDIIQSHVVLGGLIQKLGHTNVILVQIGRQNSVKELDHGDVIVEEVIVYARLQIEHRDDDVVGLLAQEFCHRNVICLLFEGKLGDRDVVRHLTHAILLFHLEIRSIQVVTHCVVCRCWIVLFFSIEELGD